MTKPRRRRLRPSEQDAAIEAAVAMILNLRRNAPQVWAQLTETADARARSSSHGAPDSGGTPKGDHTDPTAGSALRPSTELEDPGAWLDLITDLHNLADRLHHFIEWNRPKRPPPADSTLAWCANPTCPNTTPVKRKKMRKGRCLACASFELGHGRARTINDVPRDVDRLNTEWHNLNDERNAEARAERLAHKGHSR